LKETAFYIHIPFCDNICHYCDFAKTANWNEGVVKNYFIALESHVKFWANYLEKNNTVISTLFLGGGTPGLFSKEYEKIFNLLKPHLKNDVEVTLEANPQNITSENLKVWKEIGVNRLSIGVQSFQEDRLKFLVRDHSPENAVDAINLASDYFDNINIDLIYGIPDQSLDSFRKDLDIALGLGISHLSLYNLTFEQGTPIGRAFHRGKIREDDIEVESEYYQLACQILRKAGFGHEEMRPYIAIGAGAHGFIKNGDNDTGIRFSFKKNDRSFKKINSETIGSLDEYFIDSGAVIENRITEDLAVEYVTTSLRTNKGVPISELENRFSKKFCPTDKISEALKSGLVKLSESGEYLVFDPECWFFENQWGVEVLESLGL
jgi:oxygen-independent coproporphyrinogen-3 oxidase